MNDKVFREKRLRKLETKPLHSNSGVVYCRVAQMHLNYFLLPKCCRQCLSLNLLRLFFCPTAKRLARDPHISAIRRSGSVYTLYIYLLKCTRSDSIRALFFTPSLSHSYAPLLPLPILQAFSCRVKGYARQIKVCYRVPLLGGGCSVGWVDFLI